MFNNDITINPGTFGGANANTVYSLVGFSGDSSSTRRVASTANSTPDELRISHSKNKRNGIQYDQHMVRIDRTLVDPTKGPVVISAWMVIAVPSGYAIADLAATKEVVGRVVAFEQASGTIDKIFNSEP